MVWLGIGAYSGSAVPFAHARAAASEKPPFQPSQWASDSHLIAPLARTERTWQRDRALILVIHAQTHTVFVFPLRILVTNLENQHVVLGPMVKYVRVILELFLDEFLT